MLQSDPASADPLAHDPVMRCRTPRGGHPLLTPPRVGGKIAAAGRGRGRLQTSRSPLGTQLVGQHQAQRGTTQGRRPSARRSRRCATPTVAARPPSPPLALLRWVERCSTFAARCAVDLDEGTRATEQVSMSGALYRGEGVAVLAGFG